MKSSRLLQGRLAVLSFSLLLLITAPVVKADDATWSLSPTSGDWNTAENWMPNTVPNSEIDVATFGQSSVTDIALTQTVLGSLIFSPDASAYTFTVNYDLGVPYLLLYGDGVVNNSASEQTFILPINYQYPVNVQFRNSSTAGDRVTYYSAAGGGLFFFDSSNAGSANFIVSTDLIFYGEGVSAANATITNDVGDTSFGLGASAGSAVITNRNSGTTEISYDARGGNAAISNEGASTRDGLPGHTYVSLGSIDDTTTIINKAATVPGGEGGFTYYDAYTGTPSSQTIINNGSAFGGNTAGKTFVSRDSGGATFILHGGTNGGAGGALIFQYRSQGDAFRVIMDGNGRLEISIHDNPNVRVGSIEGSGDVFLGDRNLVVGTNNLSTKFAGVIQDGGLHQQVGGSLSKLGVETLTLTGSSTYTGGTTVISGALLASNTEGFATGTGPVKVNSGTLGGSGIIAGPTTIGNRSGSGPGAFLQPGFGLNRPVTLTIQSALTFKADGTDIYKLDTRKGQSDQVVAKGLTIESGAQFDFTAVGDRRLTVGSVFTALSNTSAAPITGAFSNLPDGSIFVVGNNTFQVSYSGGDGNDLTLTVVR